VEAGLVLVIIVVVLGLIFEYVNGFHDAANAIATVVATRVLTPLQAVLMAGTLNLIGALTGVAVAKTVGAGIVDAKVVTQDLVVAALLAAITWDLITWWFGLPTSSSHALIFSIIGASVAIHGPDVIIASGLQKTSFGIVYSPALALLAGYLFMLALYWLLRKASWGGVQRFFGRAQILSSAYMAFSHGGNDGQKTMGVIALALAAYGVVPTGNDFYIPDWVKVACAVAIGVGATRRLSAVRWGIAGRIVTAWVLTIPGCFLMGYVVALVMRAVGIHS
jgi:PiT family inorganic phosphate transporter